MTTEVVYDGRLLYLGETTKPQKIVVRLTVEVDGEMLQYKPQPDITTYELALLWEWSACHLIASHSRDYWESSTDYLKEHGLLRHFEKMAR